MAENHIVVQGEYLSRIAAENGFLDYTIIWDHPNNAQLKQQRQNPNVLFPGDSLFIPDKTLGEEDGATSKRHIFVVKQDQLKLRLILEDMYEKPIASQPCTLMVDDQTLTVTTDGKGKIEQTIPTDTKSCSLMIGAGDETPFSQEFIPINLGHLDPVDTLTGQQARLNNLGYFAGDSEDPQDPAFLSAVEEFQCDQSITVDGIIGSGTQAKLKQVHGC
jgi:hypothetical protein